MTMWKVTVCPDENELGWQTFIEQQIIAIGYPDDGNCPAVAKFRKIRVDDLVVAHISGKRYPTTKTAAGVGVVVSGYQEVESLPANEWTVSPRRQLGVRWLATHPIRMEDIFASRSVYGPTVVRLSDDLATRVLQKYGLDG